MIQDIKVKGIGKIIQLGKDSIGAYDLTGKFKDKDAKAKVEADVFIYWYEIGSYEGSGFAVWRNKKGEWSYGQLGHCSCYGPGEHLADNDNAKFTIEGIVTIAEKNADYNGGKVVADYLKSYYVTTQH